MIGELLRLYRVVNNITLKSMAEEIGISFSQLSRLENGFPCGEESKERISAWAFPKKEEEDGGE